ncbi:hydrolase [Citricoccus sp. SGAir0253]|uniref:zinc-dependent metalloprotease n=1 Tax=Citricoccus sp. SGAir0253 TaxID=2567881 RepID=UPI0010CD5DB9|nr:zinc-dependent metalloprotease [Citricoccus sp. SGAir0253]QCU76843.1 hydrolase [Citricoccus sp. SGAir0253]
MDSTVSDPAAPTPQGVTPPIDWDVAAATAARLCAAGPRFTRRQAEREAEGLRRAAEASVDHVHRLTRLEAARDLRDSDVLVVDRPTWIRANTQAFSTLLAPAFEHIRAARPAEYARTTSGLAPSATGVETGAVLAFLSSKVLGQYEPFCALPGPDGTPAGPHGGRLLLVAPNIAEVRVELNVDPEDFRLWVCLHEQTHRVQFAAAPWLRGYLQDNIITMVSGMFDKVDTLPERLSTRVRALLRGPEADERSVAGGEGSPELGTDTHPASMGLLELIQDPEDKARLAQLTAVMSLLEGHANVIMDGIDASVVPTVKTIRQRFDHRDATRSSLDRWVRRFLGMDAKMQQYRDGQRFVKRVVRDLGMDGFNAVWEAPGHLPTERELHHPEEWIERMRGRS